MKQECVNRRKCCLSVCCENNETSRTPAASSVNTVRPRLIVIGENHAQDLTGKGRSSCIGPSDQRGGFTVIHIQLVFSLCDGGMGWKGAGTFHCELYSIMYIVFSFSKKTFRIVLKKKQTSIALSPTFLRMMPSHCEERFDAVTFVIECWAFLDIIIIVPLTDSREQGTCLPTSGQGDCIA